MTDAIYLDNASTTALDPKALAVMEAQWRGKVGNASSIHAAGLNAALELEKARAALAGKVGAANPDEIVFTAGGSESNSLALLGYCRANKDKGRHLIVSAVEHPSVLETARQLGREGFEASVCGVDSLGRVDQKEFESLFRSGTLLASVMHANNEVGTMNDLRLLGDIAHARGAVFHTDAVQSLGKESFSFRELPVDLASFSAHKLHGPRGIGALYVRAGTKLEPLTFGGGHERGLRPGTSNVEGAMGFAAAAAASQESELARMRELRDGLIARLKHEGFQVNGCLERRLCNNVNLSFPGNGKKAQAFLSKRGIFVSTGSACQSNKNTPSHVLVAMGLSAQEVHGSLRVTLSKFTVQRELDVFMDTLLEFAKVGEL